MVSRLVVDWIRDNPASDPPSVRSWYDHSVAWRTDAIVSLMLPLLADALSVDELGVVLASLHAHGERLMSYLSDERFVGHNHNLFHALSLFNLAIALPELEGSSVWRVVARERVSSLLGEMVHVEEGVSAEQASAYHYLALRLFRDANDYLHAHGDGFGEAERRILRRMVRFGALLSSPHGSLPAIGDTAFDSVAPTDELRRYLDEYHDPVAEYVLTRGDSGTRPPDAVFYEEAGYAVIRPSYGDIGPWDDDLQVVVDMGPAAYSHGHHDAMNILLSAYGRSLIVDSGGPYAYGVDERRYFLSSGAHNVVVVDDTHVREQDARISRTADNARYSLVEGVFEPVPGVEHRRTVAVLKPQLVVILDHLTTEAGRHTYELVYHLPPSAAVEVIGRSGALISDGPAGLALVARGSEAPAAEFADAYVTTAHRERTPASVLSFPQEAADAWYLTVLAPTSGLPDELPSVMTRDQERSMAVTISWQGTDHTFRIADGTINLSPLR